MARLRTAESHAERLEGACAARDGSRGQRLVEFALVLPVVLLILVLTIDIGRHYLGSFNLQNATSWDADRAQPGES